MMKDAFGGGPRSDHVQAAGVQPGGEAGAQAVDLSAAADRGRGFARLQEIAHVGDGGDRELGHPARAAAGVEHFSGEHPHPAGGFHETGRHVPRRLRRGAENGRVHLHSGRNPQYRRPAAHRRRDVAGGAVAPGEEDQRRSGGLHRPGGAFGVLCGGGRGPHRNGLDAEPGPAGGVFAHLPRRGQQIEVGKGGRQAAQGPGGSFLGDGGRPQLLGPPAGNPVRSVKADRAAHPRNGVDDQPQPDPVRSARGWTAVHRTEAGAGKGLRPRSAHRLLTIGHLRRIARNYTARLFAEAAEWEGCWNGQSSSIHGQLDRGGQGADARGGRRRLRRPALRADPR